MSFLLTEDGSKYRKWVNVVCSILLPGSGQFLSGRKRAGVTWFLANLAAEVAFLFFYASPFGISTTPSNVARYAGLGLWMVTVLDSCRTPIPRLKFRAWAAVFVLAIAIPVVPFVIVRQMFLQPFLIPTAAMQPTLMGNRKAADGQTVRGDQIFVNKWTYRFHAPQRGDIVVFKTIGIKESERERFRIPMNEIYVKRLVGLPGERVSIRPPYVYINGQKLLEPKIFAAISSGTNGFQGFLGATLHEEESNEVQLGLDEYFVLGDNSTNSLDSRYYGPIKRDSIFGKVVWIYWPAERRRFLE